MPDYITSLFFERKPVFMDDNEKKALAAMLRKDCTYPMPACQFVADAVHYTVHSLKVARHVTGQELIRGILEFAVMKFGFLAPDVFAYWNFRSGRDIGNTVYAMIGAKILSASPDDRLEDFDGVPDLASALKNILENSHRNNENSKDESNEKE